MSYVLFIDDLRSPLDVCGNQDHLRAMEVCRTSKQAKDMVESKGIPDFIYFDHDLGGDDTAMNFVNWLIDEDMDRNMIKSDIMFIVHSANPVGTVNITCKLNNYFKWKFGDIL